MQPTITHRSQDQEFIAAADGHEAELAYTLPAAGIIDFTHTFVDENWRGQGVGEALARRGLAYARQQHLRVRTSCEFMARFVQAHQDEYQDLLAGQ